MKTEDLGAKFKDEDGRLIQVNGKVAFLFYLLARKEKKKKLKNKFA